MKDAREGLREARPEVVSRVHVDGFLRGRRKALARLRLEMGHDVVDKLHPWVVADVLDERREAALAELFEVEAPEPRRHEVLVTLRSGRQAATGLEPPRDKEARAMAARRLQSTAAPHLSRIEADLRSRDVEVRERYWLTHSVSVVVASDHLEHLAARADVARVDSEKRQFAMCLDTSRGLIRADQVQAGGTTGAGVTVSVLDTGIDATHPALAGIVVGQQDFSGAGTGDGFGHGTHCAGIVASQDGTYQGIAPGARLFDIRIMDNAGLMTPATGVAGLQAAVTVGAQVSSNSWGFSHADGAWVDPDGTCVLCTAADNAVAAGVTVVVAGGNDDNDTCSTYDTHLVCPAIATNVITVAASDKSDGMAGFSSLGPTPDGRPKPDITAPGVAINSCQAGGTALGSVVAPGFISLDGTSMACPHVAGVAALILSRNPAQTPANVKSLLMTTAVNIGATANEMGAGRVDARAAVDATPRP